MYQNQQLRLHTNSTSEFIRTNFQSKLISLGFSNIFDRSVWSYNSRDDFNRWLNLVYEKNQRFATSSNEIFIWFTENCLIEFYISETTISCDIQGVPSDVALAKAQLVASPFASAESTIEWVHDKEGNSISIPLQNRGVVESAYPWIEEGVNAFIDRYLASDASVLVLIGPPGTGKTSLIRHMILRAKASARVAYDSSVMSSDYLFANWLESSQQFMVLEDSDAFLSARKDGNDLMHKFLNVSEGLVTVAGKKLIFSTNLPNINDIDPALLRPGRCFCVLNFRSMVYDEAQAVLDELKDTRQLNKDGTYTLSQLFAAENTPAVEKKKIGFGFI